MRLLWTLLLLCTLGTCFTQSDDYTLDTGDVLKVTVLRHEQFSGEFAVPPSGRVVFPGVGEVPVRGLTLNQLSSILR
ncbi:MAG: polysaccharide biosynthesis/export family protein, partial [Fimbriimonadales bacterium]|nr:polysaccharide biosynthesis/export family protein [Fimbriimonadales bacterium]